MITLKEKKFIEKPQRRREVKRIPQPCLKATMTNILHLEKMNHDHETKDLMLNLNRASIRHILIRFSSQGKNNF